MTCNKRLTNAWTLAGCRNLPKLVHVTGNKRVSKESNILLTIYLVILQIEIRSLMIEKHRMIISLRQHISKQEWVQCNDVQVECSGKSILPQKYL